MDLAHTNSHHRETPPVDDKDLPHLLAAVPFWKLAPDCKSIHRAFVAKNFVDAMKFLNGVAELAEAVGHHPDLHLTNYRYIHWHSN